MSQLKGEKDWQNIDNERSGSKNYHLSRYQVKVETEEYDEIYRMIIRKIEIYSGGELGERR